MASGGLSPDDMQELCLHFAAKQLSANDVTGIAKSLGLTFTDQQLAQLRSCTGLAGQGGSDETTADSPGQQMGMTPSQSMSSMNSNQPASSVESQFRGLDSAVAPAAPSTRNLQQFGYSLFASRVSTFAPVANVPVSDDYVIGPGDQLKMLMWGRINNTLNLTVGRDGSVSIPEIGPLQVAGLNFAQTKKLIEDHAGTNHRRQSRRHDGQAQDHPGVRRRRSRAARRLHGQRTVARIERARRGRRNHEDRQPAQSRTSSRQSAGARDRSLLAAAGRQRAGRRTTPARRRDLRAGNRAGRRNDRRREAACNLRARQLGRAAQLSNQARRRNQRIRILAAGAGRAGGRSSEANRARRRSQRHPIAALRYSRRRS